MIKYKDILKNGMELINLTPHKVVVLDTDFVAIPVPTKRLIRVKKTSVLEGEIMNCKIFSIKEEIYG